MVTIPSDIQDAIEEAWQKARMVPGFLGENEARFLGLLAASTPATGAIVEIGSFKGKSTVMLASVAARYGLGPVVAIDPHTAPCVTDPTVEEGTSTFGEFSASLRSSGVEAHVEIHRVRSREAAAGWARPIRLLWIDGDHTYAGAKEDFELFSPHLSSGGVIAFHDALNAYEGPIRVFVEDVLRSNHFGAAGFVHSIAWSQFRPADGTAFLGQRNLLARRAARLIPFVARGRRVHGLGKIGYKLCRSRVPRTGISPAEWAGMVS
jgi:predicted O-methyltransferase YrrM